jgi:hypothetical protein
MPGRPFEAPAHFALARHFFDVFREQTSGGRQPGTGSRHLLPRPLLDTEDETRSQE